MPRNIDFLIFYEHWKRELLEASLLKVELERRGYTVELCDDPLWRNNSPEQFLLAPQVVIFPWLYRSRNVSEARNFPNDVQRIVNMQWEQVYSPYSFNSEWNWVKGEALKADHIAWGDVSRRNYLDWGIPRENIWKSGAIQLDLCEEAFAPAFKTKEELAQEYDLDASTEWLLFVSSFTLANMEEDLLDYFAHQLSDRIHDFKKTMVDSKELVLSWFIDYLQKNPRATIIYRPHPSESTDAQLIELSQNNSRFFVIEEESSKQWIRASDCITSWISTAMAEAYYMEKPFALLRPVELDAHFEPGLFVGVPKIQNYDDFLRFATTGECASIIDPALFTSFYSNQKGRFVYKELCDELEALLKSEECHRFSEAKKSEAEGVPQRQATKEDQLLLRGKHEDLSSDQSLSESLRNELKSRYLRGAREADFQRRIEACFAQTAALPTKSDSAELALDKSTSQALKARLASEVSKTKVSLIVPVYNTEDYLSECLDSVVAQTHKNVEVILVNDGATDSSPAIAEEYANKYSWQLLSQENRGLSEARHTGFAEATGEYVLFLDSDDLLAPQAVELCVQKMLSHEVDICIMSYREFSNVEEANELLSLRYCADTLDIVRSSDPLYYHFAPQPRPFPILSMIACGKLYKKTLLDKVDWDLVNFKTNEDEAFICYPYLHAHNGLVALDAALYLYRQNPESLTRASYRNHYQGKDLSRLEFFNELRSVQEQILGAQNSAYVLNAYMSNNIYGYTRDLLGTDQYASAVDEADRELLISNLDSSVDAYLELPESMTDAFVRLFAEAYQENGYSGLVQHLLAHQRQIYKHEITQRDAAISQLDEQIASYADSRSWKITAPLRKLKKMSQEKRADTSFPKV